MISRFSVSYIEASALLSICMIGLHAAPAIAGTMSLRLASGGEGQCRVDPLSTLLAGQEASDLRRVRARQEGSAEGQPSGYSSSGDPAPGSATAGQPFQGGAHGRPRMCGQGRAPSGRAAVPDGKAPPAARDIGAAPSPVRASRFDEAWTRVRHARAPRPVQAALRDALGGGRLAEGELLARINMWVNGEIAYKSDRIVYGVKDHWATPGETITRRAGDCEDVAILKMHMLAAAGIHPRRMKLVVLRDLVANADHAVLMVDTENGGRVLDSSTDLIYLADRAAGLMRPLIAFSEGRRWTYR